MARKPNQPTAVVEDLPVNGEALVAIQNQAAERIAAVVQKFGDGSPYERARLVTEAKFYMAQSAEAMLEAGKRLIIMKEHEPHGEFVQIVEDQLGIGARVAQHMMRAALKYLSPQLESKTKALSLLGKTKLLELVTESDEDLAALADGGTVAGLTLDDIDAMTSREVKAALREAREEQKAQEQLLSDKSAKIDKLQSDVQKAKRRVQQAEPDEVVEQLRKEVAGFAFTAESAIRGDLNRGFAALVEHAGGAQEDIDHSVFMAGLIGQIERALVELRAEYGVAADTSAKPAWLPGQE